MNVLRRIVDWVLVRDVFPGFDTEEQSASAFTKEESDRMGQNIAEAIQRALDGGLCFPLFITSVSTNGQIAAIRYDKAGTEPTVLCEHIEAGFQLPIHLFITDTAGGGMRATITPEQQVEWVN